MASLRRMAGRSPAVSRTWLHAEAHTDTVPQPGNALAVAALVLGINNVPVWESSLPGVMGFIFGIIGLRQAQERAAAGELGPRGRITAVPPRGGVTSGGVRPRG